MEIFDKSAADYDSWYRSKMGAYVDQVETDLVMSYLDIRPGMKVLDLGCGTGNFSIKLAEKGCQVLGVDISQEMLAIAREKAEAKGLAIDFRQMDLMDLNLNDGEFDLALTVTAFEFIEDIEGAFREIYRTVRPGGRILIGTINKDSAWGRFYEREDVRESSVFKYASLKNLDDLKALRPEEIENIGYSLFVPPESEEEAFNLQEEGKRSLYEEGGFLCVQWKKD